MRFEKKQDCYLDTKTGLEWSLDNCGLKMGWFEAMDLYQSLGEGWRLPTVEELISIVDYTKFRPATELPSTHSSNYWSSSTNTYYPDGAWYVYFHNGCVGYDIKPYRSSVRCVRGGPLKYQVSK